MNHKIVKVLSFDLVAPFAMKVFFSDSKSQFIDFSPVLKGEMYGPLIDESLFIKASIDSEVGTIVWPNGADFDPALLYDWDNIKDELAARAEKWV